MVPSPEQIRVASYHRWQRRGGGHGQDWNDWFAAEQELLFARNYEVLVRYRLDGITRQFLGDEDARQCRFCERTAPRTTFSSAVPALPEALGNTALFTYEECDECHALFRESFEDQCAAFCLPFQSGPALGRGTGPRPAVPTTIPIAAFKGLAKVALSILPQEELSSFEDTIEWISNPDHDLDGGSFGDLDCSVTLTPSPLPFSWAALARRVEDDAPMPYLLSFVGTGHAVFQIHLPLCVRDEDLDGKVLRVPRTVAPLGLGRGAVEGGGTILPLAVAQGRGARPSEAMPSRRARDGRSPR